MKKKIKFLKFNETHLVEEIKKNTPLIVIRDFFKKQTCKNIVTLCVKNSSIKNHRVKKFNKYFDLFTLDILPSNVLTNRIFRRFELSEYAMNKFEEIKKLIKLHNKVLKKLPVKGKKKTGSNKRVAVMHYPKGGGYFDWHQHIRYPTNYSGIVTLSKKGSDFNQGGVNFEIAGKKIDLEKYNISIGDLLLFRYDLKHSISKVDPKENLVLDSSGRWSLVMFLD
jgi:hypothetical protein